MVINELDCNIESLTTDDFPDVSLETASYVMEQIQLNRTTRYTAKHNPNAFAESRYSSSLVPRIRDMVGVLRLVMLPSLEGNQLQSVLSDKYLIYVLYIQIGE